MDIKNINRSLLKIQEEDEKIQEKNNRVSINFEIKKEKKEEYIPDNNELSFLEHVNFRKLTLEQTQKIAQLDYKISSDRFNNLVNHKMLIFKDDIAISRYKESEDMTLARAWLNNKSIGVEPDKNILKKLDNKTSQVEVKLKANDYYMFFKILRGEELTGKESKRKSEYLRNGISITDKEEIQKRLKEKSESWKLESSRKKSIAQHLLTTKGLDLEVLKFINTFKQITPAQLDKITGSKEKSESYLSDLDKDKEFSNGGSMLHKSFFFGPNGRIEYLTISHSGEISGRKLLETCLKKGEINGQAQARHDLRFHDLKVVDSVLLVKEELEKNGQRIKCIMNESQQFKNDKEGKLNNERANSKTFMDSIIIAESNEIDPKTGLKKEEIVAVEYGNYTTERMAKKIGNSSFDKAYVFSTGAYCQKYKQGISSTKNVQYRTL